MQGRARALTLQNLFTPREKDASSCQEQLDEFRNLVGAVRKWLRESEGKIPSAETSLGTQELQQRRQQIQVGQGSWNQTGKVWKCWNVKQIPKTQRPGRWFRVSGILSAQPVACRERSSVRVSLGHCLVSCHSLCVLWAGFGSGRPEHTRFFQVFPAVDVEGGLLSPEPPLRSGAAGM